MNALLSITKQSTTNPFACLRSRALRSIASGETSISHSGHWLVGTSADNVSGVDTEQLSHRHKSFARFVASESEYEVLGTLWSTSQLPEIWAWSIKEACFKCGRGGYEPSDFTIVSARDDVVFVQSGSQSFRVVVSMLMSGYTLAIAFAVSG